MNGSNSNSSHLVTSQDIVFATLYSFIVFFGIVGNGVVIVIVQKTPSMHTTTNYLLTNLAVADMLTLLFCPGFYDFALHNFQLSTASGDIFCKLLAGNAVVCISFDASVLTLCVIAVERYIGIVKPFNSTAHLTRKKACLIILSIWILAIFSSLPDSLWTEYNSEEVFSPLRYPWTVKHQPSKVQAYIIGHSLVLIVLPSILISFCYVSIFVSLKSSLSEPEENEESKQSMKRLLRLLVLLAVAFCTLCLPFAGFFLYVAALDSNQVNQRFASLFLIHRIVRFLIFSNSFINPLLYAAQSTNYREVLQRELCCKTNSNGIGREGTRAENRRMKNEGEYDEHVV